MDGTIKKVEVDIDDVTIDIPNPDIDPISSKFDDTDIDDVEITLIRPIYPSTAAWRWTR